SLLDPLFTGKAAWFQALLYIDQFEELFTVVDERFRAPFVQFLAAIAASERLRAIVTLRADFYGRCAENPALASLLKMGSFTLSTPGPADLYEMIQHPAQRAELDFEAGLVDQILTDTGDDAGSLALLAYALDELYNAREGNTLTKAAYDR